MNFDLDEDQQTIRRTAREFLAARHSLERTRALAEDERGFDPELWDELVGLGWTGIHLPEADGGQGLGVVELALVQEELGYAMAPTPFLSQVAAATLLDAAAAGEERERWLRAVAEGATLATFAQWDPDARGPGASPTASTLAAAAAGDALTGTKALVPDAHVAELLVVAAAGGRLLAVEAGDGVEVEATPGLDPTRKLFRVVFDGAAARPLTAAGAERLARAHDVLAVAQAAESVGVAQRALEMATAYAKERRQFGHPIGAFQAVSHACAQMLLEVEGARALVHHAAWALDHEPDQAPLAAAMAKAYASDCGARVTAAALQVHGGIGFTWEHDLHFLLKRATANAHAHGDARLHRERAATLILSAR
jgi:alkylation response protein AidB-like acyl-CoA dehydrogenase